MDTPAVSARLIGAIFVEKGLITDEQLEQALQQQEATGERLGEILVAQFGVSRLDLASALAEQWAEYERPRDDEAESEARAQTEHPPQLARTEHQAGPVPAAEIGQKRPIGEIFIERGLITEEQLEEALAEQRETGQRLGEILVAKGIVNRLALASALADQWAGLQKLRPPAPVEIEPAGPVPQATDPFPATGEAGPLDELRHSIGALQARLDQRTEEAGPDSEWRLALDRVTADLGSRIVAVEGKVAQAGPELARDVADLRAAVEELGDRRAGDARPAEEALARVGELAGRLEVVEARLAAAVATMDDRHTTVLALEEAIASSHALAARVDALETGLERQDQLRANGADAWREPLERLAADMRSRLAALEGTAAQLPADLLSELADLRAAVAAAHEPGAVPDEAAIRALTDRLDALEAAWAEHDEQLRSAPRDAWKEPLERLAHDLEARLTLLERTLDTLPPTLTRELESVRADLAALAGRVDARDPVDPDELASRLAALHARVDEVEGSTAIADRIDVLRHDVEGQLQALAEARGRELERLELLERRLGEIDPARPLAEVDELRAAVGEVRARIEQVAHETGAALEPRLGELETRLDDFHDEGARAAIEELRGRIDRAVVEASAGLAERIEALERHLAATTRLEAGLSELSGRVEELAGAVEGGVVRQLEELQARLAGVEARALDVQDEDARRAIEELRSRIERAVVEVSAGVAERVDAVGERLPAFQERLAELEARVVEPRDEQAHRAIAELREHIADAVSEGRAGLEDRIAGVEARVAEAGVERMADGLETLGKRVEEVDVRAAERAAALERQLDEARRSLGDAVGALGGELDELRDGLGRAASRDELETRFGAVERTAAEVGALTARIDELSARADVLSVELERDLRGELSEARSALGTSVESLFAQVRELGQRLGGLDDAVGGELRPGVDELRAAVGDLRSAVGELASRIDAHGHDDLVARVEQIERQAGDAVGREELDPLLAELRSAVEAARRAAAVAVGRDEVDAIVGGLRASVEELAGRVAALDHALGADLRPLVAGLREAVDGLAARVETNGRDELEQVWARVVEIERRVAESVRHEHLEAAVADVRAVVDEAQRTAVGRNEIDELRLRIDEVDRDDRLAGLDERLAELERGAAADADRARALRVSLEELSDGLGGEVRALRGEVGALRGDLDTVRGRVDEVDAGVRDELGALEERRAAAEAEVRSRIDEVARAAAEADGALDERLAGAASADDVRALQEQLGALAGDVGRAFDAVTDAEARLRAEVGRGLAGLEQRLPARAELDAVQQRLDALEHSVEGARDAAVRAGREAADGVAAELDDLRRRADADASSLGSRIDGLTAEVAAARESATAAMRARSEAEQSLVDRIGDVEQGLRDVEARVVAAQAERHESLADAVTALELRLGLVEEAARDDRLRRAVDELAEQVRDGAVRAAEASLATERELRRDIDALAATLEERDAAAIEARAGLQDDLDRVTASLGWRLEKVEEALQSAEEIERLEAAVAEVERRLDLQLAQADAQVKGTEKALRKGLKSLAARIAEGEAAYLEAGAALRGSIERLGSAIGETDARIAEREAGASPVTDGDGFVAFAPTRDGYRLVELDGPAPAVGELVEVPGAESALVVTRVARSPLPLDQRPCAYLERHG